jgi:hypothetical protein
VKLYADASLEPNSRCVRTQCLGSSNSRTVKFSLKCEFLCPVRCITICIHLSLTHVTRAKKKPSWINYSYLHYHCDVGCHESRSMKPLAKTSPERDSQTCLSFSSFLTSQRAAQSLVTKPVIRNWCTISWSQVCRECLL